MPLLFMNLFKFICRTTRNKLNRVIDRPKFKASKDGNLNIVPWDTWHSEIQDVVQRYFRVHSSLRYFQIFIESAQRVPSLTWSFRFISLRKTQEKVRGPRFAYSRISSQCSFFLRSALSKEVHH